MRGDRSADCRCDDAAVERYRARLSGPLLEAVMSRERMSARSYDRILRVARTIADLARSERISRDHLAEAIVYRRTP
jgi:predicted ATPase with chaperone activity